MSHSPEQQRKKAMAMQESQHHMKYSNAAGHKPTMEPGNDFERPGERYYGEQGHAVSKERLAKEYDKMPGGGYTHKKAGTY